MLEFVTRSLFTFIIRSVPFKSLVYECAPIYVRRRQSTVTMGFHALAQSRLSPRFSSTRKNKSFLQYFATGSGTASYQNYEEYEFVECRRKLKLSTYLQTVKNNHISFLNARSQVVSSFWVGGGKLWLSETEVQGKFKMGGGGGGLTWNALKCAT